MRAPARHPATRQGPARPSSSLKDANNHVGGVWQAAGWKAQRASAAGGAGGGGGGALAAAAADGAGFRWRLELRGRSACRSSAWMLCRARSVKSQEPCRAPLGRRRQREVGNRAIRHPMGGGLLSQTLVSPHLSLTWFQTVPVRVALPLTNCQFSSFCKSNTVICWYGTAVNRRSGARGR